MSEHLLKVLLSELSTVRVVCKKCGAVFEMPLDRLAAAFRKTAQCCPFCGAGFHLFNPQGHAADVLGPFAQALADLQQAQNCDVEFVLPQKEPTP